MATLLPMDYEEAMQVMAIRNESARMSWRAPSRISPVQASRRHSARVGKPTSYHHSPRTPNRRNTAASSKHYSAMEDHYRRMMGWDDEEELDASTTQTHQFTVRPVSWHPGSSATYDGYVQTNTVDASPTSQYLSYQNSPFYHGPAQTNLDQCTWSSYMHGDFAGASGRQHHISAQHESTSWFDNSNAQQENSNASTWTESEDEARRRQREPSVELVALGLYDEPGFTVKIGSKLEEECDPPEFDTEDDDEGESEDEEELPMVEEPEIAQASLPLDMSGRSFFLDPGVDCRSTWWSNLGDKQPQTTVNQMNHGWI